MFKVSVKCCSLLCVHCTRTYQILVSCWCFLTGLQSPLQFRNFIESFPTQKQGPVNQEAVLIILNVAVCSQKLESFSKYLVDFHFMMLVQKGQYVCMHTFGFLAGMSVKVQASCRRYMFLGLQNSCFLTLHDSSCCELVHLTNNCSSMSCMSYTSRSRGPL